VSSFVRVDAIRLSKNVLKSEFCSEFTFATFIRLHINPLSHIIPIFWIKIWVRGTYTIATAVKEDMFTFSYKLSHVPTQTTFVMIDVGNVFGNHCLFYFLGGKIHLLLPPLFLSFGFGFGFGFSAIGAFGAYLPTYGESRMPRCFGSWYYSWVPWTWATIIERLSFAGISMRH